MFPLAALIYALMGDYRPPGYSNGNSPLDRRVWERLPPMYRNLDDGTLDAFVAATFQMGGAVEAMLDALAYIPADEGGPEAGPRPGGGSVLLDPQRTVWPAWLAMVVGVDLAAAGIGDPWSADARNAIAGAVNGWRAGSLASIEEAGRRTLTNTRTIRVRALLDPDPWVLTVSTDPAETPDPDALEAAIRAVLPAGFDLAVDGNVGNWLGIEGLAPTWADIEADAPTWEDYEALYLTGLEFDGDGIGLLTELGDELVTESDSLIIIPAP